MRFFIHRYFHFAEAVSPRRNYGLDLLRAIAILLVVFCHSMVLLPAIPHGNLLYYWSGFLGVELFFVLSGYLIGSILLNLLLEAHKDAPFSRCIPSFWIRRWFRTLPNYYLFLLVNIALTAANFPQAFDYWKYFIFGQNLFWQIGTIMVESWSLAIEEWFYLSFPLVLYLFSCRFGRSFKAFALAAAFYIALFASLRSLAAYGGGVNWDDHLRKIVALRLDAIAYGVGMVALMKGWPAVMRKLRFLLLGVGLVGLTLSLLGIRQELYGGLPPFLTANLFTLTSVSLSCLLPFAVVQTASSSMSKVRAFIAGTSIMSYSMYLLHVSVVLRLIEGRLDNRPWYYGYSLYWILCFLLSFLVYTLFERRMTTWREKYARKSAAEL